MSLQPNPLGCKDTLFWLKIDSFRAFSRISFCQIIRGSISEWNAFSYPAVIKNWVAAPFRMLISSLGINCNLQPLGMKWFFLQVKQSIPWDEIQPSGCKTQFFLSAGYEIPQFNMLLFSRFFYFFSFWISTTLEEWIWIVAESQSWPSKIILRLKFWALMIRRWQLCKFSVWLGKPLEPVLEDITNDVKDWAYTGSQI